MNQSQISQEIKLWLDHVYQLSVKIGPRGSTRDGERKAAQYAFSEFEKIGLKPVMEPFKSARSIFLPHLLGSVLMLVSFVVFLQGNLIARIIASLLTILVLVTELQELGFANNIFRLLIPKGDSQNVVAVIDPSEEPVQDLILVGHLDSQRTPIIFRSNSWVKIYNLFTMIAFGTFILQAAIFALSTIFSWNWGIYLAIPAVISAVLLAAMCIQADLTPFTAGANDNATAVGMVLTLARKFSKVPLKQTRIYAVCTGCEEVQHYGMIDFYKQHLGDLIKPKAIVFEMLGCAGPAWLTQEGIIVPFKPDPGMVRILEEISHENPQWGAYPARVNGGNTEMADAARVGVPAVTLFGLKKDGEAPYWHQKADTFDKMDAEVMQKTWELTNAFIDKLDTGV